MKIIFQLLIMLLLVGCLQANNVHDQITTIEVTQETPQIWVSMLENTQGMFFEIDIENQIRNGYIFGPGCEILLGNIKKNT